MRSLTPNILVSKAYVGHTHTHTLTYQKELEGQVKADIGKDVGSHIYYSAASHWTAYLHNSYKI